MGINGIIPSIKTASFAETLSYPPSSFAVVDFFWMIMLEFSASNPHDAILNASSVEAMAMIQENSYRKSTYPCLQSFLDCFSIESTNFLARST